MAGRDTGRPVNELLQYFAMERVVYRLSKSVHAEKFVLKGALMFTAWQAPVRRPTIDIHLLGITDNSVAAIVGVVRDICRQDVKPDGLVFDAAGVEGERIVEDADYAGVRVRFRGMLGMARITMQVDIGFGDVVVPKPEAADYPTILDLPAPRLRGYSRESAVAEKFEAMVKLGVLNSRVKDFFDIWLLSRQFDFDGWTMGPGPDRDLRHPGHNDPSRACCLDRRLRQRRRPASPMAGVHSQEPVAERTKQLRRDRRSCRRFPRPHHEGACCREEFPRRVEGTRALAW